MKFYLFRIYLISGVFIAIIFFPFVNDRLNLVKDLPNLENRKLAEKPVLDLGLLDPYPAAFEKYYNDTFSFRSRLVNYFNAYNCIFLKKSPYPDKVIIGNHGWLYVAGNDMDAWLSKNRFSEKELREIKEELERRAAWLATKNCKFYVMITPGKANVYPEYIPHTLRQINKQGWGEQLIEYVRKNSNVNMVDVFSYYRTVKSKDLFYYALDNHWNRLGGFHAANAAIKDMQKDFKQLDLLDLKNYEVIQSPREKGNLKQMLGNLEIYQDTEYDVVPKAGFKYVETPKQNYPTPEGFPYPWEYEFDYEIKGSDKPRLLVFSDSFGGGAMPYLSENFSRSVKIFGGWTYHIDRDIVEKEKPDVVLLMIQEPLIRNIYSSFSK